MDVSVVIPVGPLSHHQKYLEEAIASAVAQVVKPAEILLIDDMAGLPAGLDVSRGVPVRTWQSPWRLGVAHAFNFGVALAASPLVFLLGADDWLEPECLRLCLNAYERVHKDDLGYYYVTVRYTDDRPDRIQTVPCGAAMVTKKLWQHTGGFPTECGGGASDCAFISILMYKEGAAGKLYSVAEGRPMYVSRVHDDQDTAQRGVDWQGPILSTRHLVTRDWQPAQWGRYS